mgnify:CR=1 FL=1
MEEKKTEFLEKVKESLFYSDDLNKFVFECVESLTNFDFEELEDIINYETEESSQGCFYKWAIVKNYCSLEEIKNPNFEQVKKEFLNELKECFDLVGVFDARV